MQPEQVRADFAPEVGDRRQELVFIGIAIKVRYLCHKRQQRHAGKAG
jgi:hypothetical protein